MCTLKKGDNQIFNTSFPQSENIPHQVGVVWSSIVCCRGKFFQTSTKLLLQKLLATAGHRGRCCCGCLHKLVVTAEAGATAEGCGLQLDYRSRGIFGAGALPTGLTASVTHGKIALPGLSADAIADHARPVQTVATAFRAIQRNLMVCP